MKAFTEPIRTNLKEILPKSDLFPIPPKHTKHPIPVFTSRSELTESTKFGTRMNRANPILIGV